MSRKTDNDYATKNAKRKASDPLCTRDHGAVLCVEYMRKGRRWYPHSIVTTEDEWDANWSKANDAVLVHASGRGSHIGGSHVFISFGIQPRKGRPAACRFWMSDALRPVQYLEHDEVPVTEVELRAMGYRRIRDIPGDPFEDALEVDGHIEWCNICKDHFDDDDHAPCDHLRWSDDVNRYVGPGAGDREALDAVEASLGVLCAALGLPKVEDIREAIASLKFWATYNPEPTLGAVLDDIDPEPKVYGGVGFECALLWINMLDKSKVLRPAVMHTIAWLDAWLDEVEVAQ